MVFPKYEYLDPYFLSLMHDLTSISKRLNVQILLEFPFHYKNYRLTVILICSC